MLQAWVAQKTRKRSILQVFDVRFDNLTGVISLCVCYWPSPTTMDASLATIVAGGQNLISIKHRGG
jgi:hypothetical protein